MPCTAKKAEAKRPEMSADGHQDVDFVLTTRELARMIKESSVDFTALTEQEYDAPMGLSSGAGVIFGTTGGVMEAALRTVVEKVTGKPLERIVFNEIRGQKRIREAVLDVAGTQVKIAVVDTLKEVKKMLERVRAGTADYHIIEVMSCPDGCIGGGGQPYYKGKDVRTKRQQAIYECDADNEIRKSHENPAIKEIYEKFLGEPLSDKSHKYLHVHHYQQKR